MTTFCSADRAARAAMPSRALRFKSCGSGIARLPARTMPNDTLLWLERLPSPYRPFLPSWRSPLYLHLGPLWRALERALATCEGRVLDVGCGMQPYRHMLGKCVTDYVGIDRAGELTRPTV